MNKVADIDTKTVHAAKKLISRVLSTSINYPKTANSISFFQSDTYRFYFLMSFMWEFFESNEISQEYAISLVPKKFASRIKRLQVLKQAVQLGYIEEASSTVDRRRRIYTPSKVLLEDFINYTDAANTRFQEIL